MAKHKPDDSESADAMMEQKQPKPEKRWLVSFGNDSFESDAATKEDAIREYNAAFNTNRPSKALTIIDRKPPVSE